MDAIVFGASGFIGRHLVAELLARGQRVAAAVREDTLTAWLDARGVETGGLSVVTADITRPLAALPAARDVYNTAGRYAFGLTRQDARAANVSGALHVLEWAATLPELRRLVHVSGYRVSGASGPPDYAALGAYEASKIEGDLAVRARAAELGVPLTIANPSAVIGPGQYIGPATLVRDLWNGRLPALPGGPDTFVPVVEAGYFARFLAEVPAGPAGEHYWVLDDATPPLPELIGLIAAHLGVRAPRRSIPAGLLRRLPRAVTGADPETLSFLSAERYPTASAHAFAARVGLKPPPVEDVVRAWADGLVGTRFGAAPPALSPHGFHDVAGSRTWLAGERHRPAYVLLHGLPMNADLWAPPAAHLDGPILAPDLPGLGRSAPAASTDAWMEGLMGPVRTRPVLVAHSLAGGPALRFAAAHPERVGGLVLIAPAFLQGPAARITRSSLAVGKLRRMSATQLAGTLGVPDGPAVASAAADLHRPGVARRVIAALRTAFAEREHSRALLERVGVPVQIVTGAADPLTTTPGHPVTEIAGAGHYPQLTHPIEVAQAVPRPARR
ncbi:alpha/beta fold hydrolase [Nonomuraea endophytica]|uniref:Nucleoside-diphosphate-sugar epimerase/alpha-beta hydrolase superfamily lysophospholipase n=1 Tax=Nonomuraea endophytica TaxID=714136 RepID=A0A7W8A3S1_9ACTN|nr:alpha/beta fold hydrolase [Nonomuraea endophytica]MBB5079051.1 nucleoside-diphosphate-sugar epimerase/alpha-beta hydrolase superfamily lysophospholipase [Nonomuraea endophytica]